MLTVLLIVIINFCGVVVDYREGERHLHKRHLANYQGKAEVVVRGCTSCIVD